MEEDEEGNGKEGAEEDKEWEEERERHEECGGEGKGEGEEERGERRGEREREGEKSSSFLYFSNTSSSFGEREREEGEMREERKREKRGATQSWKRECEKMIFAAESMCVLAVLCVFCVLCLSVCEPVSTLHSPISSFLIQKTVHLPQFVTFLTSKYSHFLLQNSKEKKMMTIKMKMKKEPKTQGKNLDFLPIFQEVEGGGRQEQGKESGQR